jgi:DNA-binding MarR family transcriptional regulator
MANLDPTIHQPVRLQIMAALTELTGNQDVDFTFLRTKLALTDGNLGAHLLTLEEAGYLTIKKTFVARRPKTFLAITTEGRKAFAAHVAALEAIIKPGGTNEDQIKTRDHGIYDN